MFITIFSISSRSCGYASGRYKSSEAIMAVAKRNTSTANYLIGN